MARKSKYTSEVQKADSTAVWLAGVYTRLSIEDNDSEQNSIINHDVIYKGWITPPKITS